MKLRQEGVNGAAEKFVDAVRDSYKVVAEQALSVQEFNARLTQNAFNEAAANLRAQAEDNRKLTQRLVDHQQRASRATRVLTQEAAAAYGEWLSSAVSVYQGSSQRAQRSAEERVEDSAFNEEAQDEGLPLDNYDMLKAREVIDRVEPLSVGEIRRLRDYEARSKNRQTVLERLDAKLNARS